MSGHLDLARSGAVIDAGPPGREQPHPGRQPPGFLGFPHEVNHAPRRPLGADAARSPYLRVDEIGLVSVTTVPVGVIVTHL